MTVPTATERRRFPAFIDTVQPKALYLKTSEAMKLIADEGVSPDSV